MKMEETARAEKAEAQRREELMRKQAEMKRDLELRLAAQEAAWRKEAEEVRCPARCTQPIADTTQRTHTAHAAPAPTAQHST